MIFHIWYSSEAFVARLVQEIFRLFWECIVRTNFIQSIRFCLQLSLVPSTDALWYEGEHPSLLIVILLGSVLWLMVAKFVSALKTITSLARLGIVVLNVFPTQSSLLALRIPSMSNYSAWFL